MDDASDEVGGFVIVNVELSIVGLGA